MHKVPGKWCRGDFFTKVLSRLIFRFERERVGLVDYQIPATEAELLPLVSDSNIQNSLGSTLPSPPGQVQTTTQKSLIEGECEMKDGESDERV